MIIPRITTPAIFQTYGSMRSEAAGWMPAALCSEEDIWYRKFRYQSFVLQGPLASCASHEARPCSAAGLFTAGTIYNVVYGTLQMPDALTF